MADVMMTPEQAATFERCIAGGGVAVFPSDTVYGLACDVGDEDAVDRLYALKGRDQRKSSAVMFFALEHALQAVGTLGARTRAAMESLLPGGVTLLLSNRDRRYPLACAGNPLTLGLRVPALPPNAAALHAVGRPILQSSANPSGGPDATELSEIPADILERADLVLDAGPLPGTPSTVVDLREYEADGRWSIVRAGAVTPQEIEIALEGSA